MSSPIRAKLGYVAPTVAYPVSATINPEKRSNLNWDWREVAIHDASQIPGDAQLESHGFTCVEHASAVTEFDESGGWLEQYAGEMVELARQLTGASEVVVAANGLGLGSTQLSGGCGTVSFCHNDYTAASIGRHIAELDPERAENRLSKRFAVFNMWRLVSPPPQSRPLAICDPNSVAISDLMPSMTHWGSPDEEVYHQNSLFRYNPAHRWYHFPDLTSERIIVWAGFDSDPRFPSIVPHAAFDNPDCTDPEAYRTAVHGRAYCFFDA
jgi:hypothetical protein